MKLLKLSDLVHFWGNVRKHIPTKTSDLTNDSNFAVNGDVIHKSGDETSTGFKQFANIRVNNSIKGINLADTTTDLNNCYSDYSPFGEPKAGNMQLYYCNTDAGTANISNLPEAKAFFLISITTRYISTSLYVKQICITSSNTTYSRYCSNGTWTSWVNDSAVVHRVYNETITGVKTFSDDTYIKSLNFTNEVASPSSSSSSIMPLVTTVTYTDQTASKVARINLRITASGDKSLYPHENNQYALGLTSRKWSEVHGVTYYYGSSDTEFSQKFVTTDTDQTVGGNKTFSSCISSDGSYLGNESSGNERTNLCLRANRDTAGQSCAYIGRFRQNRAQGEMLGGEVSFISFDFLENSIRYTRCFTMGLTDWDSEGVPQTYYLTSPTGKGSLGVSSQKWATINGLEPSALGMPNLSNGIDISSYLTAGNSNNTYTPPVNGWISISIGIASGGVAIFLEQGDMKVSSYSNTAKYQDTDMSCFACLPVVAGVVVNIGLKGSSNYINSAKFYPCLGNV